jgi:hypothetical protein
MRPSFRNYRPRSISAAARLTEAQRMLFNLKSRRFSDEQIGTWLDVHPSTVAAMRAGRVCPTPGVMQSLRRLVREARHV